MEDNIKQLKQDYKKTLKSANSKEEKTKIKSDYKSMKRMLDLSNKIIENDNKDMEKFEKVWDKFDKEYQKLGETQSFEEVKEELNDNQQQFEEQKKHSDEVIKKADEMIKQIDEKLAELEKAEALEKTKQDYNKWKNEVLARINGEEYQTIEEAKKKAKTTIKNKNDLTSIWEKNKKYYVVLSKDREVAFRNNYKEVVKYDDLIEKQNDVKKLFEKDSNGAYIRLIIPSEFVCLILPEYNGNMDLRGKKDLDLTLDQIIVLKKYAYELYELNKNVTN